MFFRQNPTHVLETTRYLMDEISNVFGMFMAVVALANSAKKPPSKANLKPQTTSIHLQCSFFKNPNDYFLSQGPEAETLRGRKVGSV